MGNRQLKKKILELLGRDDLEKSLDEICQLPARQAVNPLFSFFYNTNELIKWRAITAMGAVVAHLAEQDMESARVVMRRLIWNLNDESGGSAGVPQKPWEKSWPAISGWPRSMPSCFYLMSTNKVITSNTQFFKEAFSGDWGDLPIPVPGL